MVSRLVFSFEDFMVFEEEALRSDFDTFLLARSFFLSGFRFSVFCNAVRFSFRCQLYFLRVVYIGLVCSTFTPGGTLLASQGVLLRQHGIKL